MVTWICSVVSDPDDQEFLIELYEEFRIGCQPKSVRMKLTRARRHALQEMQKIIKGEELS